MSFDLPTEMTMLMPNHALHLTRLGHRGCNPRVSRGRVCELPIRNRELLPVHHFVHHSRGEGGSFSDGGNLSRLVACMRGLFSILAVVSLLCACSARSPKTPSSYPQSPQRVFDQAWQAGTISRTSPAGALVKARVVVAKDGEVLSSAIIQASGNLEVDQSVQRILDSVKNVGPFPVGVTDKRKTFIISFSAKPKR